MYVVLTRPEGQHVQITQSSMSLSDQLQELTIKYEALEDKYNTIILENIQYKQHIVDLYHQNDDLQEELQCYQQKIFAEKHDLEPILNRHISSMETSITEKDEEMEKLTDKLHESAKLMESFKSEIITIKQQNEKFRIALESGNQQKQILKKIHNDTISCKNNQICALQDELQLLRQELQSLTSDGGKTPSSISLSADIIPIHRVDWSLNTTENDTESPYDGFPAITLLTPRSTTLGPEFRKMSINSTQSIQFEHFMQCQTPMVDMDNIPEDEYKERLEILEAENAELMKKLEVLKNGCIMDDVEENQDEVDDEKEVMEEFDDDDIAEMEQLFEKCEVDSIRKCNDDWNNKYVNWFKWFEDQYKFVKVSK